MHAWRKKWQLTFSMLNELNVPLYFQVIYILKYYTISNLNIPSGWYLHHKRQQNCQLLPDCKGRDCCGVGLKNLYQLPFFEPGGSFHQHTAPFSHHQIPKNEQNLKSFLDCKQYQYFVSWKCFQEFQRNITMIACFFTFIMKIAQEDRWILKNPYYVNNKKLPIWSTMIWRYIYFIS